MGLSRNSNQSLNISVQTFPDAPRVLSQEIRPGNMSRKTSLRFNQIERIGTETEQLPVSEPWLAFVYPEKLGFRCPCLPPQIGFLKTQPCSRADLSTAHIRDVKICRTNQQKPPWPSYVFSKSSMETRSRRFGAQIEHYWAGNN